MSLIVKPKLLFLWFSVLSLLHCLGAGGYAAQILIKAEATREYTRIASKKSPSDPTTYHFVQGYFYRGGMADSSLSKVAFKEIATNLAYHLTKQNYLPSKDTPNNDVMIFVHWGTTAVEEDLMDMWRIHSQEEYEELYGLDDGTGERAERLLEIYGPTPVQIWGDTDRRKNANLLGFSETLRSTTELPQNQIELESALNRERYFLVVMAYDYQVFLAEKEMELLWVTRFSMQSTGTTFDHAYKELTFAASDYFGKNMKGLTKRRTEDTSRVEIGELEVLEQVEE